MHPEPGDNKRCCNALYAQTPHEQVFCPVYCSVCAQAIESKQNSKQYKHVCVEFEGTMHCLIDRVAAQGCSNMLSSRPPVSLACHMQLQKQACNLQMLWQRLARCSCNRLCVGGGATLLEPKESKMQLRPIPLNRPAALQPTNIVPIHCLCSQLSGSRRQLARPSAVQLATQPSNCIYSPPIIYPAPARVLT